MVLKFVHGHDLAPYSTLKSGNPSRQLENLSDRSVGKGAQKGEDGRSGQESLCCIVSLEHRHL